jgi:hypothetical protein
MAVTPKARSSAIAASGVVASVSRVSSSPLGKNVSQRANMAARAARTSGSPTTSLRILGSKEMVPPLLFTNSTAFVVNSMIRAEKSEGPDTCK